MTSVVRESRCHRAWLRIVWSVALITLVSVAPFGVTRVSAQDCSFVRGDVNSDGAVGLPDVTALLAYLYLGTMAPECVDAADANDNGIVEPSDSIYLLNFWAANNGAASFEAPPPPAPFPAAGTDPTPGVTIPDERDERFRFEIGSGEGVVDMRAIQIPVTLSNAVEITGLQMVLEYNQDNESCSELILQPPRLEEGTLLSAESAEYIVAESNTPEGVAFIGAVKDFVDPWWFTAGGAEGDRLMAAGDDQLIATLVVDVSVCADRGFSPIRFADGLTISQNGRTSPPLHNLVLLGDQAVRPVLGESGGVEVRAGFVRGDANKDGGTVDIGDTVFLFGYLFRGDPAPPCMDSADANNDSRVDLADPIWILSYLFKGGPRPSEPFPQAGVDPSDDGSQSIGCEADHL